MNRKYKKIEKVAENIARRQKDLEEFEDECKKFIGQDEYFNQEVTRILETKRFITSEEVFFLLQYFLKRYYPKTTLSPPKKGRPNVFVLKGVEDFRKFVRQYSSPSENIKELDRKLSFEGGILSTFNDKEACIDESLEFITIHHPIIKAIKRFYDDNAQEISYTAQFKLKGNSDYAGDYLFFIYLLEKAALKKDFILMPILVNLNNNKVNIADDFCDWFLANIVNAEALSDGNLASNVDDYFDKSLKDAYEYLEMIREEEEQTLRRRNDTLVNNQIESVKQATTIKVRKASEIILKLSVQGKKEDDRIVRLHKGRIRNLELSMEEKIRGFEQKRSVSVGYSLIAGGLVQIV